ncbi:MAG: ATP-binding protein [Treponema sp.]|nr:ATP-binding protein [Treponema sp.]
MFIGRDQELRELNRLYESERLEVAIMYGRRRVGKTELINYFCKGKKVIFFTAIENSADYNLNTFIEAVHRSRLAHTDELLARMIPRDYLQLLDLITVMAKHEKTILVIDEYPYLAKAEKSFSSILQKYIDYNFRNTNMLIILCGSSMSFMENQVLSAKSPLYGRRTAQFKIEPFNYSDAVKFVPNYSKEDKLLTYGIFGGTPYYLSQINNKNTLQENVSDLFFNTKGLLFEEPGSLIKQELREPHMYNAIITVIANGGTRLSEIADKVNKPANLCESYIKKLMSLGLVTKEKPMGEKSGTKSLYILNDNMFKFWFRYVQDNLSLISKGMGKKAAAGIWTEINSFMGRTFESVCIQYMWDNYDALPIQPKDIGRWWGSNPKEKQEEEIDILAADGGKAVFGECKFKNTKTGIDDLENLKRKSELLSRYTTKYYYLFSKSGFTEQLKKTAKESGNVMLVGLGDLL